MSHTQLSLGRLIHSIVPQIVLVTFSATLLLPLLWIVRVSLTDKLTAYKLPPEWFPLTFGNFVEIFSAHPFAMYLANSMGIAIAATVVSLPLATALAYSFARFDTGGAPLRVLVLASQMLPPVVLVLPLFAIFLTVGLLNSHLGIVIAHVTINLPFLGWILIAFFEGESREIEEAARVDGATRFQAFVYVAVPLAMPGILAAGLLGFILSWNEFLYVLVFSGRDTITLPVGLSTLETHRGVEISLLAAATLISLLPVFGLLPFLRKYLIRGLSLGAIK